MSSGADAHGN